MRFAYIFYASIRVGEGRHIIIIIWANYFIQNSNHPRIFFSHAALLVHEAASSEGGLWGVACGRKRGTHV